jgi:hypothetical protein
MEWSHLLEYYLWHKEWKTYHDYDMMGRGLL